MTLKLIQNKYYDNNIIPFPQYLSEYSWLSHGAGYCLFLLYIEIHPQNICEDGKFGQELTIDDSNNLVW